MESELKAASVIDLLIRESFHVERQLGDEVPKRTPPMRVVASDSERLPIFKGKIQLLIKIVTGRGRGYRIVATEDDAV